MDVAVRRRNMVVLKARLSHIRSKIQDLGENPAAVSLDCLDDSQVIREMRELRVGPVPPFGKISVVSPKYGLGNLRVDIWFIRKVTRDRGRRVGMLLGEDTGMALGWYEKLALRTVIMALLDVCEGRPCDLGLWSPDPPPTLRTCTMYQHICADDGERFIHEVIRQGWEPFLGLESGKLGKMLSTLVCE